MFDDKPPLGIRFRIALQRLGETVANLWGALVWPVERTFGALFGVLLNWDHGLEWPAALVARMRGAFAHALAALGNLWGMLIWPFERLLAWVADRGLAASEQLESVGGSALATPWRWATWLSQPLWRPVASLIRFIYAWQVTRDWRQTAWGVPALILLLPFGVVLGKAALSGNLNVAQQYRRAIADAAEQKDFARVRLYERKLAQLGVDNRHAEFRTALALADDKNQQLAYERMQQLAPEETPGYLPAHWWIVEQMMQKRLDVSADEALRLAGVHLAHALELGAAGPQFDMTRAVWFIEQQRYDEATELLDSLASQVPAAAREAMRLHLLQQNHLAARASAEHVRRHMENSPQRDALSSSDYRVWVVAEQLRGDFSQIKSLVKEWRERFPDDSPAQDATVAVQRFDLAQLLRVSRPDPDALADACLALADDAKSPSELTLLAQTLWNRARNTPYAALAIDRIAARSDVNGEFLEALGTLIAADGELQRAEPLLRQAAEMHPSRAVAWNNYAWILAHRSGPDYALALKMVNKALALEPQDFRYRETRGQIFVKLGRWGEAVDDLEYATNGLPEEGAIHAALATAYAELGMREQAESHAALAD